MELGPQLRAAPAAYSWGVSIAPVEQEVTESSGDLAPDVPWITLVWNDPVNLMSYVVLVFKKVLGFTEAKARKHMLEVHRKGRSVVWSGERERAEAYAQTLQTWQLSARIEHSSDGK